jgi:hypothetical protein
VQLKKGKKGIEAVARWTGYALDNHHGGVVLHQGRIYGASHNGRKAAPGRRRPRRGGEKGPKGFPGHWVCLDLESGKMHYAEKGIGKGCLTYADGRLYCLSEHPLRGGVVALVEPTPKGYEIKGSFNLPAEGKDYYWAHPVVLDGRLHLRHKGTLYIYDVKQRPRSL